MQGFTLELVNLHPGATDSMHICLIVNPAYDSLTMTNKWSSYGGFFRMKHKFDNEYVILTGGRGKLAENVDEAVSECMTDNDWCSGSAIDSSHRTSTPRHADRAVDVEEKRLN